MINNNNIPLLYPPGKLMYKQMAFESDHQCVILSP